MFYKNRNKYKTPPPKTLKGIIIIKINAIKKVKVFKNIKYRYLKKK